MSVITNPEGIEYYTSSREILIEDDRVEVDVLITGWEKKLRIRALTFQQMERIESKATKPDGTLDHELWVYHTIHEGVIIPVFSLAQANELANNNGNFVRELADEIWELGRISRKQWDDYMKSQAALRAVEESGNPDAQSDESEDVSA